MSAKTFKLFIALVISVGSLSAQTKAEAPQQEVFQGIYLSGDMFGYVYPIFVKDKFYSTEASLTANLKNRFFPVAEIGYGYTDMVSQLYEIGYRTHASYYRIGMDYNVQYKNGKHNYIYLGGRIGYTTFNYDVDAPPLKDPIWGGEAPVRFTDMPCRAIWAEAVGGVRAEIAKNLYLGWSLRYKIPIHTGPIANGGPWYIPGFGVGSKAVLGATYTVSYYFKL